MTTLKGAKGLLVNITGGQDLKLFEVDEVVRKIRSEVEADAEVIIRAIVIQLQKENWGFNCCNFT